MDIVFQNFYLEQKNVNFIFAFTEASQKGIQITSRHILQVQYLLIFTGIQDLAAMKSREFQSDCNYS